MSLADALVVMAKQAQAGSVKTRLVPPLTDVEAATLYTHFISDTFSNLKTLKDIKVYLAILREGGEEPLPLSIPDGVEVIEQSGDDLGERLCYIAKRLFKKGYRHVAIIGSDSPDLPPEYIIDAFARLKSDSSKVVLGPALDGGYYLIAMSRLDERPFTGIRWSTPTVLNDTIERLAGDALLLEPWYDIDGPGDMAKLAGSVRAKESAAYILERDIFTRCKDFVDGE